jgi:hypothetical protein
MKSVISGMYILSSEILFILHPSDRKHAFRGYIPTWWAKAAR